MRATEPGPASSQPLPDREGDYLGKDHPQSEAGGPPQPAPALAIRLGVVFRGSIRLGQLSLLLVGFSPTGCSDSSCQNGRSSGDSRFTQSKTGTDSVMVGVTSGTSNGSATW